MGLTLLDAQEYACFYCKRKFTPVHKPTKDHLWPRVTGQSLSCNKVLACFRCNNKKGARLPTAQELDRARRIYRKMGIELIQMGTKQELPK